MKNVLIIIFSVFIKLPVFAQNTSLKHLATHTSGFPSIPESLPLLAQGYNQSGQPNPVWQDSVLTGAGSFLSNAEDMIKFIKANLDENYSLISSSLVKTHVKQSNGETGVGWHYPMLGEKILGLNDVIWHSGMAGGYSSYIAIDKKNDCGIIVLSNTTNNVRNLGVKIMMLARKLSFKDIYK